MYEELDEYLSGSFTGDYWYDEGVVIATKILEKFSKINWEKLLDSVLSKSIDGKLDLLIVLTVVLMMKLY